MLPSEEYLTFREIAARLKVSHQTVKNWVERGILKGGIPQKLLAFKAGERWRVREEDLQDFLRRINPDTWRQFALQQEAARRQAKKDKKRLAEVMART